MLNTSTIHIEGQPSGIIKRTKILSKFDAKIHQMNDLKMPVRVCKFTK